MQMSTRMYSLRRNLLNIFLWLIPSRKFAKISIFHNKVSASVKIDINWEIHNMKWLTFANLLEGRRHRQILRKLCLSVYIYSRMNAENNLFGVWYENQNFFTSLSSSWKFTKNRLNGLSDTLEFGSTRKCLLCRYLHPRYASVHNCSEPTLGNWWNTEVSFSIHNLSFPWLKR